MLGINMKLTAPVIILRPGPGVPPIVPSAFRAIADPAQTLTGGQFDTLVFGTEVFDTDDAFAANQLIVPAEWDGEFLELTAASRTGFNGSNPTLVVCTIERSTDLGSNWTVVGYAGEQNQRFQTATYAGIAVAGDYFRARFFCNDSRDTLGSTTTLFSGGPLFA